MAELRKDSTAADNIGNKVIMTRNHDVPGGCVELSRPGLGNEDFVWIWVPAQAPELVKRVGKFVESLAAAVKDL